MQQEENPEQATPDDTRALFGKPDYVKWGKREKEEEETWLDGGRPQHRNIKRCK